MAKPIVLITGARAPAALEWARQFAAAGWRVLAADSMPHPLASWSRAVERTFRVPPARQEPEGFVKAVADICHDEAVDLVMPVCEEIFELVRGVGQLPDGTRLWADCFRRLGELHDKGAFLALASRLGLLVPETNLITRTDDVRSLNGSWFLKPCFSRFAVEGRHWRGESGSASPKNEAWLGRQEISLRRPWVAQEFLSGQGWCAYALAESGKVLALACYPVEWTAGAGACVAFTARPHPGVESWVRHFVESAALTGQMAFDFIDVPGRGVLPLECNPRATSGIHLLPRAAQILSGALGRASDGDGPVRPKTPIRSFASSPADASAMLSVPMLIYGLPQAVCRGAAMEWLRTWRTARDVTSVPGDAGPAWLGNAWTLAWFAKEARRLQCSPTAATTADLEWNGDSNISSSPE